jgi:two-component system sensor histidine kinase UhpB
VLAAAILTTILANNFVLRRRFAPLESLTRTMQRVDLAVPGTRAQPSDGESVDVQRLRESFNVMLSRLETERIGAASAVLRAQEAERARLARDLHDEVNQALAAVSMRLAATAEGAPPQFAEELAETQRLATQAMHELLGLARELRPTALDDHGLVVALRTQVRMFGERWGIPAYFAADGTRPLLGEFEQIVAYRVVQEALSNAARHAGASQVKVTVSGCHAAEVKVTVTDDGHGFDPDKLDNDRSGLAGMRERALLARARIDVRSAPGEGTSVQLTLPAKGAPFA